MDFPFPRGRIKGYKWESVRVDLLFLTFCFAYLDVPQLLPPRETICAHPSLEPTTPKQLSLTKAFDGGSRECDSLAATPLAARWATFCRE